MLTADNSEMLNEIIYRLIHLTIRMMAHISLFLCTVQRKGAWAILAYFIPMERKKVALENIRATAFQGMTESERRSALLLSRLFALRLHALRNPLTSCRTQRPRTSIAT
jgi:hypothetical protein